MATFLNSTKLRIVTPNRQAVMLCRGQLLTVKQYVGLHCSDVLNALHCFFVNSRDNTSSIYYKVIVMKRGNTLIINYKTSDESRFFYFFLQSCCNMTLNCVRKAILYVTGVYVYTSVEPFILYLRKYEYSTVLIRQCSEVEFDYLIKKKN
jgi:hypothetical protein